MKLSERMMEAAIGYPDFHPMWAVRGYATEVAALERRLESAERVVGVLLHGKGAKYSRAFDLAKEHRREFPKESE